MPPPPSAGILLYRRRKAVLEVLLIKPGGPFWKNKNVGAWMIPKGMIEANETPAEAAVREFAEETGTQLADALLPLAKVRQAGGKSVEAFAAEGDLDAAAIRSIDFEMEWPPRSGVTKRFPEAAEARWMNLAEARELMLPSQLPSQLPLLDALEAKLG